MVEALVKKYRVSESLEALRRECRENGGPENVFRNEKYVHPNQAIEKDIGPWIKDYQSDPNYLRIKAFQKEIAEGDAKRHKRYVEKAKALLSKMKIPTLGQEEAFLLRLGMKSGDVQEVLGVKKSWFDKNRPYGLRRHRMKVDIGTVVLKLEQMLRKEGRL